VIILDTKGLTWPGVLVAWRSRQWSLFNQLNLKERKAISQSAELYIDQTFHAWKLKTITDSEMKYKYESEVYTISEVEKARLVAKNNNGTVFLSDILNKIYPDATFFGLIRHPFALYESHKRRKITKSVVQFSEFYKRIVTKMMHDSDKYKNYHIIKFEEIVSDLLGSISKLYKLASLEFGEIKKIRFKAKPHFQKDGKHNSPFKSGRHYWFAAENINDYIEPSINDFQARRLTDNEKNALNRLLNDQLKQLNYI
jgi:hypothetical protein